MSRKKEVKREIKQNKTYCIKTFGCQMNENDSEKLAGMLKALGYTEEDDV